jgi:hypothetical protein
MLLKNIFWFWWREKKSDWEFLSYNLMLNYGKKYCNSRVVQKKFSGPRKNHNPPTPSCKLNGRSLMGGIGKLFALAMGHQRSFLQYGVQLLKRGVNWLCWTNQIHTLLSYLKAMLLKRETISQKFHTKQQLGGDRWCPIARANNFPIPPIRDRPFNLQEGVGGLWFFLGPLRSMAFKYESKVCIWLVQHNQLTPLFSSCTPYWRNYAVFPWSMGT